MVPMRVIPFVLLLPLAVGASDDERRLGCGFGSGTSIVDEDGDGYGETIDCDDGDASIHPMADEYCDGIDTDCDGELDEDDAIDAATWYRDLDGDGWGDEYGETAQGCAAPEGYAQAGDCYDYDPRVNPGAEETCQDSLDNDCDGLVNNDAVDAILGCMDADGDGFGDPDDCRLSCTLPGQFVTNQRDCDDSDPLVNPVAEEICDGVDNDCDDIVDPQAGDADGDGWDGCGGDCAPDDPAVHPDATEICGNGLDDDCDGRAGDCGVEGVSALGDHGLLLAGPSAGDTVGRSVALSDLDGDGRAELIVGAPYAEGALSDAGAVYLVSGDGGLREEPLRSLAGADLVLRGSRPNDFLGWSVAGAGDLDRDGLGDLVIGAPMDEGVGIPTGAAYLIFGADLEGLTGERGVSELALRLGCGLQDADLGRSVAGPGDVDGDGFDDLLLGAPGAACGAADGGCVYLLRGPLEEGLDVASAHASWSGDDRDDLLGYSVAGAGDVDGDGLQDLLLGAYAADGVEQDVGMAALVLGSERIDGSWTLNDADAVLLAVQYGSHAGWSVSGAGDVDGDGLDDLLVGARGLDFVQTDVGAAYLVSGTFRGTQSLNEALVAAVRGDEAYGYVGTVVAGLGDLDGDGFADVAVSAPRLDAGSTSDAGACAVFHGPLQGIRAPNEAEALLWGTGGGYELGSSVVSGDVDGDGWLDLLLGAPGYDQPAADAGAAWLLWGGAGL